MKSLFAMLQMSLLNSFLCDDRNRQVLISGWQSLQTCEPAEPGHSISFKAM